MDRRSSGVSVRSVFRPRFPLASFPNGARSSGFSRLSSRPRDTQRKSKKQDSNRGFYANPHRPHFDADWACCAGYGCAGASHRWSIPLRTTLIMLAEDTGGRAVDLSRQRWSLVYKSNEAQLLVTLSPTSPGRVECASGPHFQLESHPQRQLSDAWSRPPKGTG
jgi:hypothetical protein